MLLGHDSPQQILHHGGIFIILPTTVTGVQVYHLLAQPMMLKKKDAAYIGALPHVDSLIDQVVHLSGKGLTTPKMTHFLGVKKNMGPGCRGLFG